MPKIEDLSEELFEQQVQACLQHLYDYAYLLDQPLVHWLFSPESGLDPVEAFRDLVAEMIEKLRPGTGVEFHSRDARVYNLLTLHYLHRQDTADVIEQMALSTRQFYREHGKAVHTISQMLRARGEPEIEKNLSAPEISVESEVMRAHGQAVQTRIDLIALLDNVAAAVQGIATERDVAVITVPAIQPIALEVDRGLLRQTLIWIVSQVMGFMEPGAEIALRAELIHNAVQIAVRFDADLPENADPVSSLDDNLKLFVKTLEAELSYYPHASGSSQFVLNLPLKLKPILVIDDNPDVIDLFRRYLATQSYHLVSSTEGSAAIQLARELQPHLIILDIMLPGQDGLEVLQILKTQASTRQIPVLVCSVLNARAIATSLGADAFLEKPPGQAEFLEIMQRWQAGAH